MRSRDHADGIHPPRHSGTISIDGTDIRDLRLTDLAGIIGVVSQETYLLHTTLRENLRYAKPEATDAQIEQAARSAQIHDLIARLPDGYDIMVGSRGALLLRRRTPAPRHRQDPVARSADSRARRGHRRPGQRDRTRGAEGVRHPGSRPHHHHHRPPAVNRPRRDRIVVLDHGRIVETGSHDSLIAASARYADLAA